MTTGPGGLFSALFDHGAAGIDDVAWIQAMLDTEAGLARSLEKAGLAPPGAGAAVTKAAQAENLDIAAIGRQAAATGNPVPALVRALTDLVPPSAVDAVHRGATSQDIIDTAAMLLARRVLARLDTEMAAAAAASARLAAANEHTVMVGRTLLQQAVPVTFGLLAATWMTALDDARGQLHRIRTERLAVQLGGAAGTLSALDDSGPAVVATLESELGLTAPVLPWHTDRLRVLELGAALAGACAATAKIARDVTLLAQTEVAEVREGGGGSPARGGSSAMPHKQNPVAAVLVLGCAKRAPMLLATLAATAEQELQRAAGAWHAEWEPLADLLRVTTSAAAWAAEMLAGLEVDKARMQANLAASHGLPMAEQIATKLTPALGRKQAQALLTSASQEAARSGRDLTEVLLSTPEYAETLAVAGLGAAELAAAADPHTALGAASAFVAAALAAHSELEQKMEAQ